MSPLDDELRAALRGRASVLTPDPDPLAGIERRARGIRRKRIAASVASSALAVAAIALAVPALAPNTLPDQLPPPIALAVSPPPTSSVAALNLDAPWPYRGAVDVTGNGQLEKFTRAWAAIEGVPAEQVEFVPLYGEFLSGNGRLVYAARVRDTAVMEYGLAVSPDGEAQFLSRTPLAPQTAALVVPAPGDGESLTLLVVAAPDSRSVDYAPDGATFGPMDVREPGVGFTQLKGDTSLDAVRVIAAEGSVAFRGQAPNFSDSGELPVEGVPDNLLGWGSRGETDDVLVGRAVAGFARQKDADPADVAYQVLFTGSNDPGQRYTVLQAWVAGQPAQVFGWIESPGRDPE
nr:hypothetical protein [Actinomycetota bacterium]